MSRTIAVLNQKGGVGKTTTAVTLASGLALDGYTVLLVDLDTQGNVADSLGLDPGDDLRRLLSPELQKPLRQAVQPIWPGRFDVVRSDLTTAFLKQVLVGIPMKEMALANALKDAPYDAILLDCAPSVDILTFAALAAADSLLIPTRLDKLALNGVRDALKTLISFQQFTHCQLAGIVPTFYERVTRESQDQLAYLAQSFGGLVMPPVPQDAQCRVASRMGKTLWEFDPHMRALIGLEGEEHQRLGGYIQVLQRLKEIL